MRHVELHVGTVEARPRAHEAVHDACGQSEGAASGGIVLDDLPHQAEAPGLLVQRDRQLDPPVHARREVVAVVLADALQLMLDLDAVAAQQLGLADAGMLQHARRLHGAARYDDFAIDPCLARLACTL